jgi:HSP20 family protein
MDDKTNTQNGTATLEAEPQSAEQKQQQPQSHKGQHARQQPQVTQMQAAPKQDALEQRNGSGLTSPSHPLLQVQQMLNEMDRLSEAFGFPSSRRLGLPSFFDLAPRALGQMQQAQQTLWSPQVEIFEREGNIVVRADLPGLSKDDVQIEVQDDVLTLRGERKSEHEEREKGIYRSERIYGSFQRSFRLPEGAQADQIAANFQNGVLELTVPQPQPKSQQPHRVEIS